MGWVKEGDCLKILEFTMSFLGIFQTWMEKVV